MSTPAAIYLAIPEDCARALDGLRWSATGEAIETESGATFAFAPQIMQFLEGFMSVRPPLHFAHVLHLMQLLGVGPITPVAEHGEELRRAFLLAGRPMRNAGVFCAHLCHDLPDTAVRLQPFALRQELLHPQDRAASTGEMVPVPFPAFQQMVLQALQRYRPDHILHWLKFGQAPIDGVGERVAEEIGRRPPNLLAALTAAAQDRERLSGALSLVTALSGALSIPPRRLDRAALPIGGYADVTTRGEPERLLPSQHALEGDEFVRRFAEHELLYFRREEPSDPTREELVVLLDQGVRTWGGVRLGLSGAVFAFAQLAARRRIPFRLATTARRGESLDPLELDTADLTQLLEASDLTAGPGAALETLLAERTDLARDIVVLTHPRSLGEEEFAAAAATQPDGQRLFAVSLDSEGRGRMDILRDGRPLPLSRFRVNLAEALNLPAPRRPASEGTAPDAWTGDVEPVPFPFWFGPVKGVRHLAFDHSGEWLLAVSTLGVLHAQAVDGSRREVLPRGMVRGQVLKEVFAVLGAADGFVVCGRAGAEENVPNPESVPPVAFHYDVGRRRVRAYEMPKGRANSAAWFSFPDLHSIACRADGLTWGVDLRTGGTYPGPSRATELTARAAAAVSRLKHHSVPAPCVVPYEVGDSDDLRYVTSGVGTFWIEIHGPGPKWSRFAPVFDGLRVLHPVRVLTAQLAGGVLALHADLQNGRTPRLLCIRGPQPVVTRELTLHKHSIFCLSDDGAHVAVRAAPCEVNVFATAGGGRAVCVMAPGLCHNNTQVQLGPDSLQVSIGRYRHLFRWQTEDLQYNRGPLPYAGPRSDSEPDDEPPTQEIPTQLGRLTRYDPARFHGRAKSGRLRVEADRFGHVIVLDETGERLVAMFWFQRDKAAAWLPDGTRWGDPELAGPAVALTAATRLARALRLAGK